MAAAILYDLIRRERPNLLHWRIESAGTWAEAGQPVAENSWRVIAMRGIDISSHRSRMVSKELLQEFDLILTMEVGQKEGLQIEFPQTASRTFMLSEMQGSSFSVSDPYGQGLAAYQATERVIENMLAAGFDRIVSLVSERCQDH